MEYIEGTDVQLMLASQGRLHSAHAMAITAHVCDALQYAHSCGIIHRDIKPSNIMVGNNGVVKVADFGLAKMSQGQTTGLTQSGMAMGTPHFMAPEALTLGSAVDQRADIYAVGVMLYQMLTGKLPQGMFEMPSFQVPGLDPRYDRIVAKALRDDREQRYQAALELRHDLDAILTQPVEKVAPEAEEVKALPPVEERGRKKARVPRLPPPQAASPASARKKPVGLLLAVLGVVAAIAAAFVYFHNHGAGSTTQPEQATKEQPFVNSLGMKFVPVPITGGPTDGQRVLFSTWETRVQDYEVFAKESGRLWPKAGFEQGPTHPAININWEDAQAFCAWITERERKAGRLGAGEVYRLPSDHEWSCAVGLGKYEDPRKPPPEKHGQIQGVYPWGTRLPPPDRVGNLADTAYHEQFPNEKWLEGYTDGYAWTSPVGSFPANEHGLYDMSGNVWQWCEDFMDASKNRRVMRGCSFSDRPFISSNRKSDPATTRFDHGDFGFRIVLAPAVVTAASSPAIATKEAPFMNTLGMKFVPVPGTKVLFCIHETRYKDYAAYAAEVTEVDSAWKNQMFDGHALTERAEDHPVLNVSWEDAQAFCAWLSKKEGKTYRLPTDEEWSIAVGLEGKEKHGQNITPTMLSGKESTEFPWDGDFPPKTKDQAGNYSDASRKAKAPRGDAQYLEDYDDGFPTTAPVMSYQPNKLGLYDLGGNVWEWCEDWNDNAQKDRVLRGGSWSNYDRGHLLSSGRGHTFPGNRLSNNGLRVVLETSAQVASPSPSLTDSKSSTSTATKDSPFINTLGMKFVPVPIGGGPTAGKRVLFSVWDTRVQDYLAFARANNKVDGRVAGAAKRMACPPAASWIILWWV
jgi:formylglycine-generating enzyme required for sulfatase activity